MNTMQPGPNVLKKVQLSPSGSNNRDLLRAVSSSTLERILKLPAPAPKSTGPRGRNGRRRKPWGSILNQFIQKLHSSETVPFLPYTSLLVFLRKPIPGDWRRKRAPLNGSERVTSTQEKKDVGGTQFWGKGIFSSKHGMLPKALEAVDLRLPKALFFVQCPDTFRSGTRLWGRCTDYS